MSGERVRHPDSDSVTFKDELTRDLWLYAEREDLSIPEARRELIRLGLKQAEDAGG